MQRTASQALSICIVLEKGLVLDEGIALSGTSGGMMGTKFTARHLGQVPSALSLGRTFHYQALSVETTGSRFIADLFLNQHEAWRPAVRWPAKFLSISLVAGSTPAHFWPCISPDFVLGAFRDIGAGPLQPFHNTACMLIGGSLNRLGKGPADSAAFCWLG